MFADDDTLVAPPKGENATIWRYMGFAQFASLLETQCLHFTRPDQFTDPFEGTVPLRMLGRLEKKYSDPNSVLGKCPSLPHEMRASLACVNCWFVSDHESDAMWRLYSNINDGIAIRSNYKRLTECFDTSPKVQINVGMIRYMDFEEDDVENDDGFSTLMIKRNHFEHEQELRAFVYPVSHDNDHEPVDPNAPVEPVFPFGREIPVNLDTLIEAVYVSPVQQDWFIAVVRSLVKRHGRRFPINHSVMSKVPPAHRRR